MAQLDEQVHEHEVDLQTLAVVLDLQIVDLEDVGEGVVRLFGAVFGEVRFLKNEQDLQFGAVVHENDQDLHRQLDDLVELQFEKFLLAVGFLNVFDDLRKPLFSEKLVVVKLTLKEMHYDGEQSLYNLINLVDFVVRESELETELGELQKLND